MRARVRTQTHLSFGKEYTAAVEAKQVAQQEAERARFVVDKVGPRTSPWPLAPGSLSARAPPRVQAEQDKKSTIIRAQGEARSAELIGQAVARNPGYIELRRLEAARTIAGVMAQANNAMYLNADTLLLNQNHVGDGKHGQP